MFGLEMPYVVKNVLKTFKPWPAPPWLIIRAIYSLYLQTHAMSQFRSIFSKVQKMAQFVCENIAKLYAF